MERKCTVQFRFTDTDTTVINWDWESERNTVEARKWKCFPSFFSLFVQQIVYVNKELSVRVRKYVISLLYLVYSLSFTLWSWWLFRFCNLDLWNPTSGKDSASNNLKKMQVGNLFSLFSIIHQDRGLTFSLDEVSNILSWSFRSTDPLFMQHMI